MLTAAASLVFFPPVIIFGRRTVRAALDQTKIRCLLLANTTALPDVCPVRVYLIVEGMIDWNAIAAVRIDCVCQKLESGAMPCAVISPTMVPVRCDEEVSMDGFME